MWSGTGWIWGWVLGLGLFGVAAESTLSHATADRPHPLLLAADGAENGSIVPKNPAPVRSASSSCLVEPWEHGRVGDFWGPGAGWDGCGVARGWPRLQTGFFLCAFLQGEGGRPPFPSVAWPWRLALQTGSSLTSIFAFLPPKKAGGSVRVRGESRLQPISVQPEQGISSHSRNPTNSPGFLASPLVPRLPKTRGFNPISLGKPLREVAVLGEAAPGVRRSFVEKHLVAPVRIHDPARVVSKTKKDFGAIQKKIKIKNPRLTFGLMIDISIARALQSPGAGTC